MLAPVPKEVLAPVSKEVLALLAVGVSTLAPLDLRPSTSSLRESNLSEMSFMNFKISSLVAISLVAISLVYVRAKKKAKDAPAQCVFIANLATPRGVVCELCCSSGSGKTGHTPLNTAINQCSQIQEVQFPQHLGKMS